MAGPSALPALTHSAAAPTPRSTRTTSIFHMGGDCTGSSRDSHSRRHTLTCSQGDRNVSTRPQRSLGVARGRHDRVEQRRRAGAAVCARLASDDRPRSLAAVDECVSALRGSRRTYVRVLRRRARLQAALDDERRQRRRRRPFPSRRAGAQAHEARRRPALRARRRERCNRPAATDVFLRRRGGARRAFRAARTAVAGVRQPAAACARHS